MVASKRVSKPASPVGASARTRSGRASRCGDVQRVHSKGDAAAFYARVCHRCGETPLAKVAADLATRGALVLDLRLCSCEALSPICVLLREAPGGIQEVVLRDGLSSLGTNPMYRARVDVHRRRHAGALQGASLRLLVTALSSFLAVRGSRLQVLDLSGAPLGKEPHSLLMPLARALRSCRTAEMKWLGLSGCHLGDRGLALLLPWLAGAENLIPHLQALLLGWNKLTDLRLVGALVRARAQLCSQRRAVPLQLLDLSGNLHLV